MFRKYTRTLFFLPFLFFCFAFQHQLLATHIVGGEITYRCLGNNQYEIMLRVFRDCDTGVPWFDNPAAIGVFDSNNNLVYDLRLLLRENDTLDLNLNDPCLVAPPNICIHTTSYVDTVNLPFLAGGYQLVYQRCCRNIDIVNIVSPLDAGATYSALISEQALLTCNSSATFNEWPPVYICVNRPIFFDHSATDIDGDSLVYEMCTPLDGATPFDPMPQPPYNPPYTAVGWLPGFSDSNMLGGTDSLRINYQSGLLQGTPTLMGVFVVGICVSEYRNGVLIATTRRDFQYAIGVCGQLVSSAFFAPEIQCDNSLMVQFLNNSTSLGTGYVWDFGDSTINAGSNLANPIYIYPDTGTYTIRLIADPGTLCSDTTTRTINLQYESIIMDFDVSVLECSDTTRLQIVDLTIDTISNITSWSWNFGNGQTSNVPFASTFYTQSGTYPIGLTVQAANGCRESLIDTITLNVPNISSADTVAICPGVTDILLNPGGDTTHSYQWSPATGLSSTTAASPIANPLTSTTYNVTVTAMNGVDSCFLYKTVTVLVAPPISLNPIADTATCNDTIIIAANGSFSVVEWSYNSNYNPIFSNQNPAAILLPAAPSGTNIFVRARDAYGCQVTDVFKVNRNNIPINPDFSFAYQGCTDDLTVSFQDQTTDFSQGPIVAWNWNFGNSSSSSQQNPTAVYSTGGSYFVQLSVLSSLGCTGLVIYPLDPFVLPLLNGRDSAGICQGQTSVQLNQGANPAFVYNWSPGIGLSSTTSPSPIANPAVPTTYTVTISAANANFNCVNVDTVFVGFPPPVTVTVPDQVYCGSTVTLTASSPTAVSYEWAGNPSFFIILSTSNPASIAPTTFPFSGFYVRATDAFGCTATDFALVQQSSVPVNATFSAANILCSDTVRIQFNNTTSIPSGTTISTINWTVLGTQVFSSTQQNPVFNFVRGGSYTVTMNITLSNGCSGSASQVFDMNIPTINSAATVAVCPGQTSVLLNAGADSTGIIYNWSPASGLSNSLTSSPIATPPSFPFTYTVTITATNSFAVCQNIRTITVVSPPPVTMSLEPDTTFCDPRHFVYGTPTPGVVRWEWTTDPTWNSYFLINVNPVVINFGTFPFTYTLFIRAYDQYGCTAIDTGIYRFVTDTVPVNAIATPLGCSDDSLSVQFNNLTIPIGGTVNQLTWNFGGANISNANNPQFTYGASDSAYIYSLTVRLTNGCVGTFTDTIDYQVPNFASNDSLGLCGDTSPIILNQGGNPNMIYQWSPATGLSSSTTPSPLLTPSGNITYTVTITAPNNGDTCSAVQLFTVYADTFNFNAVDDTLICENRISLYVNADSTIQVDWALDPNFTLIIGSGNPFLTNLNTNRRFYVRAENQFGCIAYDSLLVRVRTTDVATLFDMTRIGCGDSLTIDFRDLTSDTAYNPISAWNWSFGDGNFSSLQNPTHSFTQAGSYQVTLSIETENGCDGTLTMPITVQLPSFAGQNDTIISCGGIAVALNPGADSSLSYFWSPAIGLDDPQSPNPIASPSVQQTYSVTVSGLSQIGNDRDTCEIIRSVTVAVPPPISLNAGADSTFCSNSVSLNAVSNVGTVFEWALNNSFNNIISSQQNFNLQQTAAAQNYYVRATDAFGCSVYDSVNISQRTVLATIDSAAVACPNQPAVLNVTNQISGDVLNYNWTPNSMIVSGQGTASISSSPDSNTQFTVFISNQFGCTDTLSAMVTVSSTFPQLDIAAEPDTVFLGTGSQLTATENSVYSYNWQTDPTLSSGTLFNPIATPIQTTLYVLTVTDPFGCSNRDSITIFTKSFVCEEPYVFVPNTFTPDGDGLNDFLFVRGNVITELYFAVYNRWGELIFETSSQDIGWDGTFKGQQLSPDVYGYYLRYKCIGQNLNDKPQFKKGNTTLIR